MYAVAVTILFRDGKLEELNDFFENSGFPALETLKGDMYSIAFFNPKDNVNLGIAFMRDKETAEKFAEIRNENLLQIKDILEKSKTIAMIGVSSEKKGEDPTNLKRKPANVVMKYMQDFGYKVIPVNPFAEGETINGETVVESLDNISEKVDIVDVFRPSKETPGFAKEAVKIGAKTLWLQYGIQNEEAKKISEEADVKYIENKCIKQEYQKLFQKSNPVFPVLKK